MAQVVAEGIFIEKGGKPTLIAGRRKADGGMRFPMPLGADAALPRLGYSQVYGAPGLSAVAILEA